MKENSNKNTFFFEMLTFCNYLFNFLFLFYDNGLEIFYNFVVQILKLIELCEFTL
jgi:hypothetical protein